VATYFKWYINRGKAGANRVNTYYDAFVWPKNLASAMPTGLIPSRALPLTFQVEGGFDK
jgi:hypothetical protein